MHFQLLLAGTFAWLIAGAVQAAPDGARVYSKNCAVCHGLERGERQRNAYSAVTVLAMTYGAIFRIQVRTVGCRLHCAADQPGEHACEQELKMHEGFPV